MSVKDVVESGDLRISRMKFPDYEVWLYQRPNCNPWVMVMNYELTLCADLHHQRVKECMHLKDWQFCEELSGVKA